VKENEDGTTSVRGGVTSDHKDIIMNSQYDTKANRKHEAWHTLFFDNDNAKQGIGKYPPQNPNQSDINSLINNPRLPSVIKKPEDEKKTP